MGRSGSKRNSAPFVAPLLVLSDCIFVYLYICTFVSFRLLHRTCLALRAFSNPGGTPHNQQFTLFSHLKYTLFAYFNSHTLTADGKRFVRIRCNCKGRRFAAVSSVVSSIFATVVEQEKTKERQKGVQAG